MIYGFNDDEILDMLSCIATPSSRIDGSNFSAELLPYVLKQLVLSKHRCEHTKLYGVITLNNTILVLSSAAFRSRPVASLMC
jgi:hypothetical protein